VDRHRVGLLGSGERYRQLTQIVRATPWLIETIRAVRDVGPPGSYVAAGAVRDTVWNWLTDRLASEPWGDLDVVYFDPTAPDESARHEAALSHRLPAYRWEVTNQAFVHRWHERVEKVSVAAHRSIDEALATWPETATAVGVRLLRTEEMEIVAPLGLDDLFDLVVRKNGALPDPGVYERRIVAKRWATRWPELVILPSALPD
jgi:hypothetical protein